MGMTPIPLAKSDYRRGVAQEPVVYLRNRFIEANPVLTDRHSNYSPRDETTASMSFIARPGLRFWQVVGDGPIRAIFSQPGAFNDDVFVVSYNSLFRVSRLTGTPTLLTASLDGADAGTTVRMAATGNVGTITPYLWIADGSSLQYYTESGNARGSLSGTAIADNDVVVIGAEYYKFTAGPVDTGTPDGTGGNPWLVNLGASLLEGYTHLSDAINGLGTAGTDYSSAVVPNPDATSQGYSLASGVSVVAIPLGIAGNAVVTTTTGANIAWSGGTLAGGGDSGVFSTPLPDAEGAIDVAVINSFVIVIPAQGNGINGRFYWINPGEITVDPLDYATAERSPDPVWQVTVFNDQFWLPGQNTTEVYYMSGDINAPVKRLQGVVFDRGTIQGTAIQIKDFMAIIDSDGGVFKIQGGEQRISTPAISELLRVAINQQNILLS
jgi:hypothetical protein